MRGLRFHVEHDHPASPDFPALRLYADVILDAVDLVHGVAKRAGALKAGPVEVAAARVWISNGNIGVVTFNQACGYLGWDAEHVRRAIFSTVRDA